jgi:excisionase family DNA binding protein
MSVEEASEFLQLHPESVRAFARRGRLPAVKVGREWRFRAEDLDNWFEDELKKRGGESEQA